MTDAPIVEALVGSPVVEALVGSPVAATELVGSSVARTCQRGLYTGKACPEKALVRGNKSEAILSSFCATCQNKLPVPKERVRALTGLDEFYKRDKLTDKVWREHKNVPGLKAIIVAHYQALKVPGVEHGILISKEPLPADEQGKGLNDYINNDGFVELHGSTTYNMFRLRKPASTHLDAGGGGDGAGAGVGGGDDCAGGGVGGGGGAHSTTSEPVSCQSHESGVGGGGGSDGHETTLTSPNKRSRTDEGEDRVGSPSPTNSTAGASGSQPVEIHSDLGSNLIEVLCKCLGIPEAAKVLAENKCSGFHGFRWLLTNQNEAMRDLEDKLNDAALRSLQSWLKNANEIAEVAHKAATAHKDAAPKRCRVIPTEILIAGYESMLEMLTTSCASPEVGIQMLQVGCRVTLRLKGDLPEDRQGREEIIGEIVGALDGKVGPLSDLSLFSGSIILVFTCQPSPDGQLPDSLVAVANSGRLGKYRVIEFDDGSPGVRMDGFAVSFLVSEEIAQALWRMNTYHGLNMRFPANFRVRPFSLAAAATAVSGTLRARFSGGGEASRDLGAESDLGKLSDLDDFEVAKFNGCAAGPSSAEFTEPLHPGVDQSAACQAPTKKAMLPSQLAHTSEELVKDRELGDREIVMTAVKQYGQAMEEEQANDPQLVKLVVCNELKQPDCIKRMISSDGILELRQQLQEIEETRVLGAVIGTSSIFATIQKILRGDFSLPDFQRCWQWPATHVADLFESIISRMHVPEIVLWQLVPSADDTDEGILCRGMPVFATNNDACQLKLSTREDILVLDGQQRLSALTFLVLYNGCIPFERVNRREGFTPQMLAYHPSGDERQMPHLRTYPGPGRQSEADKWPRIPKEAMSVAAAVGPRAREAAFKSIVEAGIENRKDEHGEPYGFMSVRALLVDSLLRDESGLEGVELRTLLSAKRVAINFWTCNLTFRTLQCDTQHATKVFKLINGNACPLPLANMQLLPAFEAGLQNATRVRSMITTAAANLAANHVEVPDQNVAKEFARELIFRMLKCDEPQAAVAHVKLGGVHWEEHSEYRVEEALNWSSEVKESWGLRRGLDNIGRSALTVLVVSLYRLVDCNGGRLELTEAAARTWRLGQYIAVRLLWFAQQKSHEKAIGALLSVGTDILQGAALGQAVNAYLPKSLSNSANPALATAFLTMIHMLRHFETPGYVPTRLSAHAKALPTNGDVPVWEKHHFYPKTWCSSLEGKAWDNKMQMNSIYNLVWLEKEISVLIATHPSIYLKILRGLFSDGPPPALIELHPSSSARISLSSSAKRGAVDTTIRWDNPSVKRCLKGVGGGDMQMWKPANFNNNWLFKEVPKTSLTSRVVDDWLKDNFFFNGQNGPSQWPGLNESVAHETAARRRRVKDLIKRVAQDAGFLLLWSEP